MSTAKKNVKISLSVNAVTLWGIGQSATPTQIDDNCSLKDDNDGTLTTNPVNFESNVYTGKQVTWEGSPDKGQENEYDVDILEIIDKTGTNDILTNVQGSSGKVTADVNTDAKDQTVETYNVKFQIEPKPNPYNMSMSFPIDPKLKANT